MFSGVSSVSARVGDGAGDRGSGDKTLFCVWALLEDKTSRLGAIFLTCQSVRIPGVSAYGLNEFFYILYMYFHEN